MKSLTLYLLALCLGSTRSDSPISEELSRRILRDQWSAFGDAGPGFRSSVNRNFIRETAVKAPAGEVKGFVTKTEWNGVEYSAFLGMPYGKPPVGDLRFAAPVPAQPWTGVYDATYQRPSCLQFEGNDPTESEDCLYINVFTPNTALESPLPVMVFIYGGAFISGSSNTSIYGPDLILEQGVVLVTFNYRLGVLGFLSVQSEEVPGNAGLKDQVLALKWVQSNIRAFGGDPGQVTIFGESAGAASVNYHILSPSSTGLFHKAIMQSGTANSPWAYVTPSESIRFAKSLASKLNCDHVVVQNMINCLRKLPARDIINEEEGAITLEDILAIKPFAFVPTTEPSVKGAFLTVNPSEAILENKFNPVPVIIGSNSREGLIVLPALKKADPLGLGILILGGDLSVLYPKELRDKLTKSERAIVHRKIKKFYFGNRSVGLLTRDKLINLVTDTSFTIPIQQAAALMANTTESVYNYVFSYDGPYGFYKEKLGMKREVGVCHGDELGYLFYDAEVHENAAGNRVEADFMVNLMTRLWANFAKTGNPTPDNNIPVKWERRTLERHSYMDIGSSLKMQASWDAPLAQRIDFWYDLVTNLNA